MGKIKELYITSQEIIEDNYNIKNIENVEEIIFSILVILKITSHTNENDIIVLVKDKVDENLGVQVIKFVPWDESDYL